MLKRLSPALLALAATVPLSSCITAIKQTYKKAVDPRTLEMQLKDDKTKLGLVKEFAGDPQVKALGITPYSYLGVVYLVGEFEDPKEKARAEAIAKARPEVKGVTAHLLKKPAQADPACGLDDRVKMKARITAAFIGDKTLEAPTIQVQMVQCQAVLLGLVDKPELITTAVAHAKAAAGVKSVKTFLTVYDPAKDPWAGQ